MKTTPGKWYIDSKDETKAAKIRSTIHKEGKGICLVYPNKEWAANAKLICEATETKKQRDELLGALKDLFDECAILRKQIPLKDQNMLNPKHKKAYERYSSRMIDAEQAIKNAQ